MAHQRIHDDEPDTSEPVVRSLLEAECPHWAGAALDYLATSGTDNAMWRVRLDGEADVVARLPRRPGAAAGVHKEVAVLRQLATTPLSAARTPVVRHLGAANDRFPHAWSVLGWIDGTDAWTARDVLASVDLEPLAIEMARTVAEIGSVSDPRAPGRRPGHRGGPLGPLLDGLEEWLRGPEWNAAELVDVPAVQRVVDQAREVNEESVTQGFVHGDLIPGNLLVENGRLRAVIDWGGAGWGDLAQDLAPAWALFEARERAVFREAVDVSDAAWVRGRAFELEHAVGGVLYYEPKGHVLGDVMRRTLDRILSES